MQQHRPWQKQVTIQQKKSRKQKDHWIAALIFLGGLAGLVVFMRVLTIGSSDPSNQAANVPASASLSSYVNQSPTYSAVKGMWLGADESIWFHTLGKPLARKTMGKVVVLTMPLTHTQGIGAFYLEERVGMHVITAIDLIAPSIWNRQDGISLCDESAGEEVNLSDPVPLKQGSTGFSQQLTVMGSSVEGSMSVFYFQRNAQAIKACTASLGSYIAQSYTPPW